MISNKHITQSLLKFKFNFIKYDVLPSHLFTSLSPKFWMLCSIILYPSLQIHVPDQKVLRQDVPLPHNRSLTSSEQNSSCIITAKENKLYY